MAEPRSRTTFGERKARWRRLPGRVRVVIGFAAFWAVVLPSAAIELWIVRPEGVVLRALVNLLRVVVMGWLANWLAARWSDRKGIPLG